MDTATAEHWVATEQADRLMLPDPAIEVERRLCRECFDEVLKTLTYREREIVKLRFGIGDDGYTYTLEEIGKIFGVTRERVRQVVINAIRKLQHPMRAGKLEGFLEMM